MTKQELNDLSPETQAWVKGIRRTWELDSHHEKLLLICGQALDRIREARQRIKEDGAFYEDKHGVRRPHPALKAEHDAKILFSRNLRELDLDAAVTPATPRPPAIRSNRR
jgi:hypothetical protein